MSDLVAGLHGNRVIELSGLNCASALQQKSKR